MSARSAAGGRSKFVDWLDAWAENNWTLARGNDGSLYAFGLNNYGQLGVKEEMVAETDPETGAQLTDPATGQVKTTNKNNYLSGPTVAQGYMVMDSAGWDQFAGDHHIVGLRDGRNRRSSSYLLHEYN